MTWEKVRLPRTLGASMSTLFLFFFLFLKLNSHSVLKGDVVCERETAVGKAVKMYLHYR